MPPGQLAARVDDAVGGHSGSGSGMRILANAVKFAAIGALAAGLVVAAVAAAPVLLAGATAGAAIGAAAGGLATFGGAAAVIGGALSGASQGIHSQRDQEQSAPVGGGCSKISVGSPNVFVEGKAAARARTDKNSHGSSTQLKQGSATVFVNGKPFTRKGDCSCCGGKVISSAARTYVGGPPSEGPATGSDAASAGASGLDGVNWGAWESGLGIAGLVLGIGAIGSSAVNVIRGAGGLRAAFTTVRGVAQVGTFGAEVGGGYVAGEALHDAGGAVGGAVSGPQGAVGGALIGEAISNAFSFSAAARGMRGLGARAHGWFGGGHAPAPHVAAPHAPAPHAPAAHAPPAHPAPHAAAEPHFNDPGKAKGAPACPTCAEAHVAPLDPKLQLGIDGLKKPGDYFVVPRGTNKNGLLAHLAKKPVEHGVFRTKDGELYVIRGSESMVGQRPAKLGDRHKLLFHNHPSGAREISGVKASDPDLGDWNGLVGRQKSTIIGTPDGHTWRNRVPEEAELYPLRHGDGSIDYSKRVSADLDRQIIGGSGKKAVDAKAAEPAFTPSQLRDAIRDLPDGMTPSQLREAIANLRPPSASGATPARAPGGSARGEPPVFRDPGAPPDEPFPTLFSPDEIHVPQDIVPPPAHTPVAPRSQGIDWAAQSPTRPLNDIQVGEPFRRDVSIGGERYSVVGSRGEGEGFVIENALLVKTDALERGPTAADFVAPEGGVPRRDLLRVVRDMKKEGVTEARFRRITTDGEGNLTSVRGDTEHAWRSRGVASTPHREAPLPQCPACDAAPPSGAYVADRAGSALQPSPNYILKYDGVKVDNSKTAQGRAALATLEQMKRIYEMAPKAKAEIDGVAEQIAAKYNGRVAKAPLKSEKRVLEKANNDYGGDVTRVKDIARNTIIVDGQENFHAAVADLQAAGAKVKVIDGAADPMGYSGANSNLPTSNGLLGEVQVNTPEMIYAKEPESLSRALLGDEKFAEVQSKVGLPGGEGHHFYEQWRSLPPGDPQRLTLEQASREYYATIRQRWTAPDFSKLNGGGGGN